ncbi:MAG: flavodoxin [Erysipelotrichaceae bacterium]|nr:flavodoxin [Erysipelotrichaceae bacterium]
MNQLIAYFSATGTTAEIAKKLSKAINADTYEIKPINKYTSEDLDWRNPQSRSSVEMKNLSFRPEMIQDIPAMEKFDTIYIGFPIWWYIAPSIINTFLESFDSKGKNIVLFATSGSSGFGKTIDHLKNSCPEAALKEGFLVTANMKGTDINRIMETL